MGPLVPLQVKRKILPLFKKRENSVSTETHVLPPDGCPAGPSGFPEEPDLSPSQKLLVRMRGQDLLPDLPVCFHRCIVWHGPPENTVGSFLAFNCVSLFLCF